MLQDTENKFCHSCFIRSMALSPDRLPLYNILTLVPLLIRSDVLSLTLSPTRLSILREQGIEEYELSICGCGDNAYIQPKNSQFLKDQLPDQKNDEPDHRIDKGKSN